MGSTDVRNNKQHSQPNQSSPNFEQEVQRLNMQWRDKRDSFHNGRNGGTPRVLVKEGFEERPACASPGFNDNGLAEAAAAGRIQDCSRILAYAGSGPNVWGQDGTSPLCAASLWNHSEIVQLLLDAAADPRQPNRSGSHPTALHCAALQEHGKICMALLGANADPLATDRCGITPKDYASCSEAVWPHFAALGCARTPKEELIKKGVIRKASAALEHELLAATPDNSGMTSWGTGKAGVLKEFSRPGSAYVVTAHCPPRPGSAVPPGYARPASRGRIGSRSGSGQRPIDILAESDEFHAAGCTTGTATHGDANSCSLRSLGL